MKIDLLNGLAMTERAADVAIGELEALCHGVSYVGQAEEHERNAHNGVQDGHHLALWCLRCDVAVACKKPKAVLTTWFVFISFLLFVFVFVFFQRERLKHGYGREKFAPLGNDNQTFTKQVTNYCPIPVPAMTTWPRN